MAEIPVERKKRGSIWPWILGVLVIGLLIWLLADNNVVVEEGTAYDEQVQDETLAPNYEAQRGDDGAQNFVQYVEERNGEISKSHEYTSEALRHMANALDDLYLRLGPAAERGEITDELRTQAEQITQNPGSEKHANIIKDAFMTAANALQNLQANYFPNLTDQATSVMDMANEIEGTELATEQSQEIDNFFEQAANTVDEMTNQVEQEDLEGSNENGLGTGLLN